MAIERPLPLPDEQTRGFWEGCREGELRLLRCQDCRTYIHQPAPMCHVCNSTQLSWKRVSGRGTLYTWVVVHQAPAAYETPYVLGWIEVDEQFFLPRQIIVGIFYHVFFFLSFKVFFMVQ